MQRTSRFAAVTLIVIFAVVWIAGPAGADDKKTTIQLVLDEDLSGEPFIEVQPRDAKIWRNKPDKPKKVEWWWETNNTSFPEIFWEIRYDSSKGGATADYFGNVDIGCGETSIKVQPDKKPEIPKAEWPYSITVFACEDGVKAQKIATMDPRIIWQD
jgi:hypothetical protein